MKQTAFETYILFTALKQHFTTKKYDFFKYHGRVKGTEASFLLKRDRFQYQKLSKKYNKEEMQDFIVSNLLKGKKWVGELFDEDAEPNYFQYIGRRESFNYVFKSDLDALFSDISPCKAFKVIDGQYPDVLMKYLAGSIGLDTFAILDRMLDLSEKYNATLGEDDVLWSKASLLSRKLYPFLDYDKNFVKSEFKSYIQNTPSD